MHHPVHFLLYDMLFFKKSKLPLRDLFDGHYTDIHSHLIYGIDDGAKTPEDSFSLVSGLISIGFEGFIATPHTLEGVWDNTTEGIKSAHIKTQDALKSFPQLRFDVATEYMMNTQLSDNVKSGNELMTLKDKIVLIEMSYLSAPVFLYELLFDIQNAGYKPLLAHPERYLFYHGQLAEYRRLKKVGCLFQLNLLSTTGYYGTGVLNCASELLTAGLIDYVGSDVHHENHLKSFQLPLQIKKEAIPNLQAAIKANQYFAK